MPKRPLFHWTQESALYIELMFKRQIIRGFRTIDHYIPIEHITLLDAGCGNGQLTREIAEYLEADRIYGCDINLDDVTLCQQKNPNSHYFQHDLLLPFKDQPQFDVIMFTTALAQFSQEEQALVLDNAMKQLSPNGFIWIIDVNTDSTLPLFKEITQKQQVIYQSGFSKSLLNRYSIFKLPRFLPLTLVHIIDKMGLGTNVLTQLIYQAPTHRERQIANC